MPSFYGHRGAWGQTKPQPNVRVDFGHPLAQDLRCCFVLGEAAGMNAYDHAAQAQAPINAGSQAPTWLPDGALRFNGTGTGGTGTGEWIAGDPRHPSEHVSTFGPFTMDAVVRIAGITHGLFCGLEAANAYTFGGNVPGVMFGVGNTTMDNNGTFLLALNENVAWHSTGVNVPQNAFVHVAFVFQGFSNDNYAYIEGREVAQLNFAAAAGGAGASGLRFWVGGYNGSAGAQRSLTGDIATARLWRRTLRRAQIAQLARDPYAFMVPS